MLDAMLAHGRSLGCQCAWVLTDRANTPAMRLYAGAGGVENPTPAIMFEFPLT
jgi:aminoglycoside 6'-N-acetyltransferase I